MAGVELLFVLGVGLAAGTISGIVGFGSSIMLMPVLVIVFGPLHAVPIMAIAAILANLSRVLIWWREVDWRAVAAYSVTGVPAAALGARTLLVLPPRLIECALGVFFLLMIPARRWLAARGFRLRLPHLLALGAVIGFLTGIVVTTGPITAPIFLAARSREGRVHRHRGRRLARGLREQDRRVPPLRRPAAAGDHAGPHHRRLAHGRRLDRQALRAPPAPRPLPPPDGRADAPLRPHDALDRLGSAYIPTFPRRAPSRLWRRNVECRPDPISALCSPMRGGARRIGGRWPSKESGSETTS